MGKQQFDKFINKASAAKKKETFRQEKKALKAEMRAEQEARKKETSQSNERKYGTVTSTGKKVGKAAPSDAFPKGRAAKATPYEAGQRSKAADKPARPQKAGEAAQRAERPAPLETGRERKRIPVKTASTDAVAKRKTAFDTQSKSRTEKSFDKDRTGRSFDTQPKERTTRFSPETDSKPKRATRTVYGKTDDEKAEALNASLKPSAQSRITTGKPGNTAKSSAPTTDSEGNAIMPLNKFIAHAGICGRREAAELVKEGAVVVNGDKIFEPGFKVSATDKIKVKGKPVFLQKNLVYILLNKPKDYITTAKDPEGRKTVLELIKGATQERVYPVGRLDRNTTGVLLLTNDGELAQKLTHPSFEIKKIYEVKLDKPLQKKDFESILSGITLEDGFVQADALGYADSKDKSVIGIQIHSGRNRIVRRIFEHLGYDVRNLDRVMFANLTKKNVERSKWRLLSEKEVRLLKYMNQSFVRKREKKDA